MHDNSVGNCVGAEGGGRRKMISILLGWRYQHDAPEDGRDPPIYKRTLRP
jgi:hypothetical protein